MRNCKAADVPCHRVIGAGGALGGYGGNLELKRGLLRAEGLLVSTTRVRDFAERRWPGTPKSQRRGSKQARGRTSGPADT